jgi:hypothetical protein
MGFVFAAVFLWLARPSWKSMLASLMLVVPGLWLRGYASGYVKKNAELATTGPYAHTRNPLYLGSMLIAFGFAAAAASWVVFLALVALFAAIYIPTILGEEAYLREHFAEFETYAREVPRLLPRLRAATTAEEASTPLMRDETAHEWGTQAGDEWGTRLGGFSWTLYRKHREYNALMGAGAIYAALVLKFVWEQHEFFVGASRPAWWP